MRAVIVSPRRYGLLDVVFYALRSDKLFPILYSLDESRREELYATVTDLLLLRYVLQLLKLNARDHRLLYLEGRYGGAIASSIKRV